MSALIYPRKVKVADPKLIFGWESSDLLNSYAPYSLHPDEYEVANYKTIGLSAISGYAQSVNAGYAKLGEGDEYTKINSEALIPPGTRATMFMMEYEAFDPYTNEWVWVPSKLLLNYDSIWIKESEGYSLAGLHEAPETASPRAGRLRRVLRQVRQEDWSWSAPEDVAASSLSRYVDGKQDGVYEAMADIPVWAVPADSEIADFGEAAAFIVLDHYSKMLQPIGAKPPTLGVDVEPADTRMAVILNGESLNLGWKLWEGNESVLQLCSELLRMIHPVRYEP